MGLGIPPLGLIPTAHVTRGAGRGKIRRFLRFRPPHRVESPGGLRYSFRQNLLGVRTGVGPGPLFSLPAVYGGCVVATKTVEERVIPLAERVAAREGCELVHCAYVHESGRWFLRLYIDHPDGITIDHCTAVSRQMSALLDVEDLIPRAYNLEVSSPGLDRPLNTADDYVKFAGEQVSIRTNGPIDGRRRFRGLLQKFEDEVVTVADEAGRIFEIPLEKVRKARLDPRI